MVLVQLASISGVAGLFVALDYIGGYLYTEVAEAVLYSRSVGGGRDIASSDIAMSRLWEGLGRVNNHNTPTVF